MQRIKDENKPQAAPQMLHPSVKVSFPACSGVLSECFGWGERDGFMKTMVFDAIYGVNASATVAILHCLRYFEVGAS